MTIEPSDVEFFDSAKPKRLKPDTLQVLGLAVGEVINIKNHHHRKGEGGRCRKAAQLRQAANRAGLKVAMKHVGRDLLIKRTE